MERGNVDVTQRVLVVVTVIDTRCCVAESIYVSIWTAQFFSLGTVLIPTLSQILLGFVRIRVTIAVVFPAIIV